jgi:hypothetical protein
VPANVRDEARHLLDRPLSRVLARRPQPGHQQVAPAEHVQRQVAITVVIAVEEPPLLHPVHRVVGRIQIEDDLARRALVRLQELVDEKPFDGDRIVTDLVIARRLKPAQLQSVQRRLARNRRTILASRRELASQHRHHRIVAQVIVVAKILVAQRDPEHPLPDQCHHLMLDPLRTPLVVKTRRKPIEQADRTIRRPQQ